MIIHKVKMENFRGFQEKTIDFQSKPVVLLSAANGIGKTTTVDAIEWCLTGKIGRLKAAFDTRSTNDDDRKMNTSGILKHRDADKNAQVRVSLWLFDGEQERVLCREQKHDELNPAKSTVTLDGSKEQAKAFIQEYIGDSFYNFHFCDIQKSFNIQSQKRKKLDALFGEFITNYDDKTRIAENLEIFAEDANRYAEDKKKLKVPQTVIDSRKAHLAKAREAAKQVSYPAAVFYPDEKTELEDLNREALLAQKEAVQSCGYQVALEALTRLADHEDLKNRQAVIREIAAYWQTRGDYIVRAVEAGLHQNTDAITAREQHLEKLNSLVLTERTILQNGESVAALKNDRFTSAYFLAQRQQIESTQKRVDALSAEIDLLSKNNKMLKLLLSLTGKKKVLLQYRDTVAAKNGTVRGPVCGSESFATMEDDAILREAGEYIRQNGEATEGKNAEKAYLQAQIDELYQDLVLRAQSVVGQEKENVAAQIRDLRSLNDAVQPYFQAVKKLQRSSQKIQVEELTAEKAAQMLSAVEDALLAEAEEQRTRDTYQQILTVLGYRFEHETVKQTLAKVKKLPATHDAVTNFSYDALVSKLNALDSLLANRELLDLQEQLNADEQKNRALDAQIAEYQELSEKASQRAKDIKEIVQKLSEDEYKKVGPALSKFYNKLARFNAGDGIEINPEEDGISLVDSKGKNLVNVLSNGQISVFMLAHFFAGINARNDREKMKVYFIDDLTACMDDVNMLAFMDLLKYQMSSKATMEQLFFITCDDRISNLLKYKLTGRGIELCELGEADF